MLTRRTAQALDALALTLALAAARLGLPARRRLMKLLGKALAAPRYRARTARDRNGDVIDWAGHVLGMERAEAARMLRDACAHLYGITADARSIRVREPEAILSDFRGYTTTTPEAWASARDMGSPLVLATFHSGSYLIAIGYISLIVFGGRSVALFKAYPPSPTEQVMIDGLRRQGVNLEIHVLAEGAPINRAFLRRIRETNALLFHMCDATPKSNAVLTVDWLGARRLVSSGVLDLARLLDAPILPVTNQSGADGDQIDVGSMFPVERVKKERSLVLQEIMAIGERQIRRCTEQWQLWHDWHAQSGEGG